MTAASPSHYDTDVLVIGAGLSGLYAAMELEQGGREVRVVEASQQVGGRIRTILHQGRPLEIGGTGLGPSHHRAHALTARFDLETAPLTRRGEFCYAINGALIQPDEWENSPANLTAPGERDILPSRLDSYFMQTLVPFEKIGDWIDPAYAGYDIPFGDHLRKHGVSDEAMRLINTCINCNDIERVSALSIFRDALKWRSVGYNDPKNFDQYGDKLYQPVRLVEGMARMPEAMAKTLAHPVTFGFQAAEVVQDTAGVTVTATDGRTVRARKLIVSVPMATLSNISFSPALPETLATAIGEAQYSGNTQFYLTTDHPFWEEDGFNPSMWTDTIFERLFVEFEADGSVDHLRIWINGDNAARVDALGDEAEAVLLDTLAKLRPSTRGHLKVFHRVSWGSEPLIRGEKYVMGAGQVTRFARALAEPAGNIHWAGEHHKSLEVGIEAALQSGERAARELLEAGELKAA